MKYVPYFHPALSIQSLLGLIPLSHAAPHTTTPKDGPLAPITINPNLPPTSYNTKLSPRCVETDVDTEMFSTSVNTKVARRCVDTDVDTELPPSSIDTRLPPISINTNAPADNPSTITTIPTDITTQVPQTIVIDARAVRPAQTARRAPDDGRA